MSVVSAANIEQRVEQLERRVAVFEDVKAELAQWIGEARRYERLYTDASARESSRFRELTTLREGRDARVVELERLLDVIYEAARCVWPLVRDVAGEDVREALDHVAELASRKTFDEPPPAEARA